MYGRNNLQGQFTCFHFLISLLKAFTISNCFSSLGIISQILGPRKEMLSVPLKTDTSYISSCKLRRISKVVDIISFIKYLTHQKHSSGGLLQKRCSQKFRKIHRKTPAPESKNTFLHITPLTLSEVEQFLTISYFYCKCSHILDMYCDTLIFIQQLFK